MVLVLINLFAKVCSDFTLPKSKIFCDGLFGSVKIFLIDEKYFHANDLCIVLLLQESCMYAEFRVLAVFLKLQEGCVITEYRGVSETRDCIA